MIYKYLYNITTDIKDNKEVKCVIIDKKEIKTISVTSDYNVLTNCNKVTINVRKDGQVIESRSFLDCYLFPSKIERTKTSIKVYLTQFENEN